MKSKDGVKIIPYCKCGKLKPFDEWVFPNKEAKAEIQKQRQGGCIKFIGSVCPECLAVKR